MKQTHSSTVGESSAQSTDDENDQQSHHYAIIGTISSETDANGVTAIYLDTSENPFDTVAAFSNRFYSSSDVGKKVVCMPLAGQDCLMIAGFMPEPKTVEDSPPTNVLDTVLATTQPDTPPSDQADKQKDIDESEDEKIFNDHPQRTREANNIRVIADGKEAEHLLLRAKTAITIQCGESSISLTSDGRVRINGRYIHSRASHTQRISGGAVKVN